MYKPSLGSNFSSGYVLPCLALSILITSCGSMLVINDFVLLILFAILPKFLIQTADTFSGS